MPVKFVVLGVIVVVAVGIAVYENEDLRNNITDFIDRSRQKLAQKLHHLADNVNGSPHQHERTGPHGHSEPMAMGYVNREAKTSGADYNDERITMELTRRGTASNRRIILSDEKGDYKEYSGGNEKSNSSFTAGAGTAAVMGAAAAAAGVAVATVSEKAEPEHERESGYESERTSQQQQPQVPENAVAGNVIFSSGPSSVKSLSSNTTKTISDHHGDGADPLAAAAPVQQPPPNEQPYWHIQQWAENTTAFEDDTMSEPSLAGSARDESTADMLSEKGSDGSEEFEDIGSVVSWTEVGSEISGDGH